VPVTFHRVRRSQGCEVKEKEKACNLKHGAQTVLNSVELISAMFVQFGLVSCSNK
jgi:hypothetical protein